MEDIAKAHQRTEGAIKIRLRKLALEFYNEGRPLDEIEKLTGCNEEDIKVHKSKTQAGTDNLDKKLKLVKKKLQDLLDII